MIINSWLANSLIISPSSQSSSSTIAFISQIYAIPNNFTDLKPKYEWFCDMSKSSIILLLGEMKTLLKCDWNKLLSRVYASRTLLISLVGKSESTRESGMDTRASCFP
jgi:hypothetical protein